MKEVPNWEALYDARMYREDEPIERDKRYGRVREVFDESDRFILRFHLPEKPPPHPLAFRYGLPKTFRPYELSATLLNGCMLQVRGIMMDEELRALCGLVNSFPDRFHVDYPLAFMGFEPEIEYTGTYTVDVKVEKNLKKNLGKNVS